MYSIHTHTKHISSTKIIGGFYRFLWILGGSRSRYDPKG